MDQNEDLLRRVLTLETVHSELEKHLEQHIEEQMHYNLYEHKQKPLLFVARVFFFGALGVLCGAAVEAVITTIPNDESNQGICASILLLQLFTVAVLFLIASYIYGYTIDNWVMETWAGFLFALTFFTSQQSLTTNTMCTFQLK